jgi:hypothetical protein
MGISYSSNNTLALENHISSKKYKKINLYNYKY